MDQRVGSDDQDLEELMGIHASNDKLANRITDVSTKVLEKGEGAMRTTGTLLSSSGILAKEGINKLKSNPTAVTTAVGLGAAFSGLVAANDFVQTIKTFMNPNNESNVSWLMYALRGIITGGLASSLAAPFLGLKNTPLHEIKDGKSTIRENRVYGAAFAAIITSVFIATAKGISFLNKIPILGPMIGDTVQPVSQGLRGITSPEAAGTTASPGGGMPAGLPA